MQPLMLSDGPGVTPHDVLQLPRPATAIPNPDGTLALWPASTFSFNAAHGNGRTDRTLSIVDLVQSADTEGKHDSDPDDFSRCPTPRTLLDSLASLQAAWLDTRTVAFLRPALPKGVAATLSEQGTRVDHPEEMSDAAFGKLRSAWADMDGGKGTEVWAKDVSTGEEYLVGKLPVPISDLTVLPVPSSSSGEPTALLLAFSATVFPDGSLWTVASQEEALARAQGGGDGKVYDGLFVRHWDEWAPTAGQRRQVHVVRLERAPMDLSAATTAEEKEKEKDAHPQAGDESDSDASLEEFEFVEKPGAEAEAGAGARWAMQSEERADEAGVRSAQPKVYSPLAGTKLECPVGPFGGASDFSLSPTHLIFHAKDPHVNPAWHTRTHVYSVPLAPRTGADARPRQLTVGTQGACASPVVSADGKRVAWLEMREDGYEADRNRVVVFELESGRRWGATEEWDTSPGQIWWNAKGDRLYLEAEEEGHVKVFALDVPVPSNEEDAHKGVREPVRLTDEHTVTGVAVIPAVATSSSSSADALKTGDTLLLTWTSLRGPAQLSTLSLPVHLPTPTSPPFTSSPRPLASLSAHLLAHKKLHRGTEFRFAGDKGQEVHGWVVFPPECVEVREKKARGEASAEEGKKRWPLAFLCHGGPESAWNDSWSTRWNPNTFASRGYIVVAINRTGSTGFGARFTQAIRGDWGGAPFCDLVAGLQFVKDAYPEIDPERTACLGASYGGFMVNWIQGHNEQMGFKALVCHDGVFSTFNTWNATEELYFPEHEFGGVPWESADGYARFNPQNFVKKWRTPQLVIHGSKDYRLVEGEGLGVFNTLQRLSVPSRLLVFPSENHWVLNPWNSAKWHDEVFRWIDEWTAPSAAAPTQAQAALNSPSSTPRAGTPVQPVQAIAAARSGYVVGYGDLAAAGGNMA
ncbi:hypothetical protein JCM10207_004257 [Rhodosporidiobolus poonsookiae]